MQPPAPIPLTILTGPAGAGKTTLLNLALADPGLAATLVLQNGPGRAALEATRAVVADDGGPSLSACLCCGPRDDLARLFEDMLRRRDNNRIAPFARVVFETAGVADPARLVAAIHAHPYLGRRYALAGVLAVVDAGSAPGALAQDRAAAAQVESADAVVLSRPGGPGADEAGLAAAVAALNPGAAIVRWPQGPADAAGLFLKAPHDPARRPEAARRALYRRAMGGARPMERAP